MLLKIDSDTYAESSPVRGEIVWTKNSNPVHKFILQIWKNLNSADGIN